MPPDTADRKPHRDALVSLIAALAAAEQSGTELSYALAREALREALDVGLKPERLVELLDIGPAILVAMLAADWDGLQQAWVEGYDAAQYDARSSDRGVSPNPYERKP